MNCFSFWSICVHPRLILWDSCCLMFTSFFLGLVVCGILFVCFLRLSCLWNIVCLWRKNIFDIYVTEYGTALTTILPILFLYLNTVTVTAGTLNRNESGRFGALKSDSTHHFFRNACTKSGSLRFSQFSGCWMTLSVYILMSFDFPFVRLFGVRYFCYYPYCVPNVDA